ncbi:MAG: hypothetical protein AB7F43_06490 [Bacteriovoracia bacterium]
MSQLIRTIYLTSSFVLVVVTFVQLSGCTSLPAREVHSAAGLPRSVRLEPVGEGLKPHRFRIGAGADRGDGYSDTGDVKGSFSKDLSFEVVAAEWLSVGARPYLIDVLGNFDASSHLGIEAYVRLKAFQSSRFRLYVQPSFRAGSNEATEGSESCFLFFCSRKSDASISDITISEYALSIPAQWIFGRSSLALVSSVYFDYIDSGYTVNNVKKASHKAHLFTWSELLYFGYALPGKTDDESDIFVQMGGGVTRAPGFGEFAGKRYLNPIFDLSVQFGFR